VRETMCGAILRSERGTNDHAPVREDLGPIVQGMTECDASPSGAARVRETMCGAILQSERRTNDDTPVREDLGPIVQGMTECDTRMRCLTRSGSRACDAGALSGSACSRTMAALNRMSPMETPMMALCMRAVRFRKRRFRAMLVVSGCASFLRR
jgi:hypothetical protein